MQLPCSRRIQVIGPKPKHDRGELRLLIFSSILILATYKLAVMGSAWLW